MIVLEFWGAALTPMKAKREIPGVSIVTETECGGGEKTKSVLISKYAGDRSRTGLAALAAGYQIERRDLAKRFRIDPQRCQYRVVPILELLSDEEKERFQRSGRAWQERFAPQPGPDARELHIQYQYEQTGEEKSIFGCTARRWITTRRSVRDLIHGNTRDESVFDEWYIASDELEDRYAGYSRRLVHRGFVIAKSSNEQVVFDHAGERPRGLCVNSHAIQKHHAEFHDGTVREQSSTYITRVVNITKELFSESEFEPPAGFRQMPLYPSRFAIMRGDLVRSLKRWSWRLAPRTGRQSL
jgi:hypothetical protein